MEEIITPEVLEDDSHQYPPKPRFAASKSSLGNQVISALLFIILYYFFFERDIFAVLSLVLVIFIHESGHYAAMKLFNFKDVKMFFVPFFGAYVSGTNDKATQRQNTIMILAGPVPGIIIGSILLWIEMSSPLGLKNMAYTFLFLNLFNLLPVTPLDGGRLVETMFLESKDVLKKIFTVISIAIILLLAINGSFFLLILAFFLGLRLKGEIDISFLRKKLREAKLNFYQVYEDISDKDYWQIRAVIIQNTPSFSYLPPHVYRYDLREGELMNKVNSALDYRCEKNLGFFGKFLVLLIWILSFLAPILIFLISQINQTSTNGGMFI